MSPRLASGAGFEIVGKGARRGGSSAGRFGRAGARTTAINPDWITVACGPTLMRHPPNLLASLAEIQRRQIPVIISGVFEGGFLVGANRLDGRLLRSEDDPDRSTLAWRKAFVALCDGHGISPAHACIRFALALPGVVAVRVESSYADRVAQIRSSLTEVSANFWASMQEEGLLRTGIPCLEQPNV